MFLVCWPCCLAARPRCSPASDAPAKRSTILAALQSELDRSFKALNAQDPPAYFLGYTVTDTQRVNVSGSNGALLSSDENRNRWLEVSVRTGSYDLDNTHKVGERQEPAAARVHRRRSITRRKCCAAPIWLETDKQYRSRGGSADQDQDGQGSESRDCGRRGAGLSRRAAAHRHRSRSFDQGRSHAVGSQSARVHEGISSSPAVINSIVTFTAQAQNAYQITSEGTQLQFGQIRYRLEFFIRARRRTEWTSSAITILIG